MARQVAKQVAKLLAPLIEKPAYKVAERRQFRPLPA
jgi:hypothetical protein